MHNPQWSCKLHPPPTTKPIPLRNGSRPAHQRSPTYQQWSHLALELQLRSGMLRIKMVLHPSQTWAWGRCLRRHPQSMSPDRRHHLILISCQIIWRLTDRQYRCVFNSCSVGMATATMGGSFIDCNSAFKLLSHYSQQELKATTIFNQTRRGDLQAAFDMMSQLITMSIDRDSSMIG